MLSLPGARYRICVRAIPVPSPAGAAHIFCMDIPRNRDGIGRYTFGTHRAGPALKTVPALIPGLVPLSPAAQQVLDACRAAGGRPLIVGGSVRDALLGDPSSDVDIEVHGAGMEALQETVPGEKGDHGSFGVLHTVLNGEEFDLALPRRADGTTEDVGLEEAFARRDFTINAMGWDPETGELIDPFGGRSDLEDGVLRHTGESFDRHPVHVLRGIRFAGRYGFDLAPETLQLCRDMAPRYAEIPREKVWGEFQKIAAGAPRPSRSLEALYETGWDGNYPALADVRGVPQDPVWHPEGAVDVHLGLAADAAAAAAVETNLEAGDRTVAVLAALLHDVGKAEHHQLHPDGSITNHGHAEGGVEPAREFLNAIGAPGHIKDKVLPIIREHMCHTGNREKVTHTMVFRLIRRLNEGQRGPTLADWARVVDADLAGRGPGAKPPVGARWLEVAEQIGASSATDPILRGPDLESLGMKKGQEFSWIIRESLDAQDDGVFTDREGALAWAAENRERIIADQRPRWEALQAERRRLSDLKIAKARAEAKAVKQARRAAAGA